MKNLLALLVVGGVFMFFATMEDEKGVTFLDKMTGEDSMLQNIQKAEVAADVYKDATQERINAEFGY